MDAEEIAAKTVEIFIKNAEAIIERDKINENYTISSSKFYEQNKNKKEELKKELLN